MKIFVFVLSILIGNHVSAENMSCRNFTTQTTLLIVGDAPEDVLDYHFKLWATTIDKNSPEDIETLRIKVLWHIYMNLGRYKFLGNPTNVDSYDAIAYDFCGSILSFRIWPEK